MMMREAEKFPQKNPNAEENQNQNQMKQSSPQSNTNNINRRELASSEEERTFNTKNPEKSIFETQLNRNNGQPISKQPIFDESKIDNQQQSNSYNPIQPFSSMNKTQLQGIGSKDRTSPDSMNKPLRPPSPPKHIEISKNMHNNTSNGTNMQPKLVDFSEYENNGQGMSTPVKLNYMNNNRSSMEDNPTLHMSAKQKRFYDKLQQYKLKNGQKKSHYDIEAANREMEVRYDSVQPDVEQIERPHFSMNLMATDPFA